MSLYRYLRRKLRAIKNYFWPETQEYIFIPMQEPQISVEKEETEEKDVKPESKPFPWRKAFDLGKDYFFNSDEKWIAWLLLIGIVVCVVAIVALTATFAWWSAGFWALLTAKAAIGPILVSLGYLALQITAMVSAYVIKSYLIGKLSVLWRDWLTTKLIKQLFSSPNNYLDLHRFSKKIENLSQRIQEDVKNFVELTLNLSADLLKSVLSFGTFVGTLWVVGGALAIGLNFVIPGYLVWVALIVAVIASVMTYYIGRSLAETNKNKEKAEAEFRDELSILTNEAENIAVESAENYHEKIIEENLKKIKEKTNEKLKTETKLNAFQNFLSNISSILPVILSLPLYFAGLIDLGSIMQVSMSFFEVSNSLSWFSNTYQNLSEYQSSIERITEIQEAFEEEGLDANPKSILRREKDKEDIKLKNLTIMKPQAESTDVIIQNLNLSFKKGENVLLKGENGTGKSTIFKVIRGTWKYGEGKVTVPVNERLCFLPQMPTIPKNSTLKGILAFPRPVEDFSEEEYLDAFNAIKDAGGMAKFIPDLHREEKKNWGSFLSGGQKQLISIARAILQKPDRLFLDEATAAMDNKTEDMAYRALKEKLPETTLVSIAHRSSVKKFHSRIVYFGRNEELETEVIKEKHRASL
ncbi:MAG: ABC transporter ATP-binding protein/permease [Tatlockia sp.]|nr:ABC transporter ATP-binding protein/permease [Tatlockia sp.]